MNARAAAGTRAEDGPRRMWQTLTQNLRDADGFVDVGTAVCEGALAHGLQGCSIELATRAGVPTASIDNLPGATDPDRVTWLAIQHRADRLRDTMYATRAAVVGAHDGRVASCYVPLLDELGVIGTLRLVSREPVTEVEQIALATIGTQVSVQLAKLGLGAIEDPHGISRLTRRQLEIAQLAATGLMNRQIADRLELSDSTVKKHLKDVFLRLAVCYREELAGLLLRALPLWQYPEGVTRIRSVHVTRLDLHRRANVANAS